jgi:ribosomal protein S20
MPITSSAKKALRKSGRNRTENLARTRAYTKIAKEYKKLVLEKKLKEAQAVLPRLYKALDKAAKTSVITKNKASRLKSRLSVLSSQK